MTSERLNAWTPQEPPPDFADRTMAVLLRERSRRRPRVSKRWIAGGLMAAVLVAGAAFGLTGVVRRPRSGPAAPRAPTRISVTQDDAALSRAVPPVDRAEVPPAPAQDTLRRMPRLEASAADAGARPPTHVKVPRCDCSFDQVICTCF
jgi:hypothetical protein